jgi:hypothetical protein
MPQAELIWTSPRLESGDFSPEDPLAIDHLQQQIGNILWPGFTTRTTRAFYYVMVCYGLRTIDDLLQKHGIIATDDHRRAWFERWEKLWALAICASFDGAIPSRDAMRGKRGVIRAWQSSDRLFLGYPLISRQLELGAMGAYRSSLIQHGLLSPHALRPTPIGAELGDLMWAKEDNGDHFDSFIGECLDPSATHALEKHGKTTLKSLGQRCRLSVVRQRADLQATLSRLLTDHHPTPVALRVLPEMARHLTSAREEHITQPREFLLGVISGRWGHPSHDVLRNARVALAFGDLASALRACFDRAYQAVVEGGYQASIATTATACLRDKDAVDHVARCLGAWRDTEDAAAIVRAEAHGPAFAGVTAKLDASRPQEFLVHLLDLHKQVQVARGKSRPWLSLDGDRVLLEASNYTSWSLDGREWVVNFKFWSMSDLLRDLGRVA